MAEDGDDGVEAVWEDGKLGQIDNLGLDADLALLGQLASLGQADRRSIHGQHRAAQSGQIDRIAPFAFGQAEHPPAGDAIADLTQEIVGFLAVGVAGGGVALIPHDKTFR